MGSENGFEWTPDREEKLKKLIHERYSDEKIARLMGGGCTRGKVKYARKCLEGYGTTKTHRIRIPYSLKEDLFITDTYCNRGWLLTEISSALNRDAGSVKGRINKLNLVRNISEEALKERRSKRHKEAADRNKAKSFKGLWTVRTDRARAALYKGRRYEDATVVKHLPNCGRLG